MYDHGLRCLHDSAHLPHALMQIHFFTSSMLHGIPMVISSALHEGSKCAVLRFHAAQGLDLTRTVDTDEVDLQVLKKRGHSHMQDDQVR